MYLWDFLNIDCDRGSGRGLNLGILKSRGV